jgi:hypothetical protein
MFLRFLFPDNRIIEEKNMSEGIEDLYNKKDVNNKKGFTS